MREDQKKEISKEESQKVKKSPPYVGSLLSCATAPPKGYVKCT